MTREDLRDLQEDFTIKTNNNNLILYHATTQEKAKQIVESQSMFGLEDGLFFSNIPDGQIEGYGVSIIQAEIPLSKVELDDQFSDELHFRMPCKPNTSYKLNVKYYNQ
jgi:hypothetical protein